MMWSELSAEQKKQYEEYCNNKYGKTITRCETGEPMYFDENRNLLRNELMFDLLFPKILN